MWFCSDKLRCSEGGQSSAVAEKTLRNTLLRNCRVQLPFRIPNRSKHVWKVGWWLSTLATVFIVTTDFLSSYWSGPLDALFEVDNESLRILFQLSDQRFRELFLVRLRSHMPPIMGLLWYGLSLITCKGSDEFSCHSFTTATTTDLTLYLLKRKEPCRWGQRHDFRYHLLILLKLLIVTHICTTHVHRCEWSEKKCIDKQHGNVSLPPATMLFSFLTDIELDL